jgi:hypothetical protein
MARPAHVRVDYNPIVGALAEPEIALHFVELTPFWSQPAEPALSPVPAFIIGGSEPITAALQEAQHANVIVVEGWKLVGVHPKR